LFYIFHLHETSPTLVALVTLLIVLIGGTSAQILAQRGDDTESG
jgi:hypothetical protein